MQMVMQFKNVRSWELLKKIVKDRNLALIVDELGADEGRDVLDIMAVLLDLDELSPQGNCAR